MSESINPTGNYDDRKEIKVDQANNVVLAKDDILRQTGAHIQQFFQSNGEVENSVYSYESTLKIVRSAQALCMDAGMDKQGWLIVNLAAWFLQTGYRMDTVNPLVRSAELAEKFLKGKIDNVLIGKVKKCILATRFPQQPVTLMTRILCDAANYQLADKNYPAYLEFSRRKLNAEGQNDSSEIDWLKKQLQVLDEHIYFTKAARKIYEKAKQKNKKRVKKMLVEMQNLAMLPDDLLNGMEDKPQAHVILEDKVKLERGVESLFRITSRRHMELSNMAHNKASLLITINALIISVVLSVLATKLQSSRQLILPTVMLIMTNVCAMILAFISTRPVMIGGKKKAAVSSTNETNILFFGHFLRLSLDEFKIEIRKTIVDKEKIYDSLSRDIYYQGLVLTWKYRFITISYYVFIIGLVLSVLAFIFTFIFNNPAT